MAASCDVDVPSSITADWYKDEDLELWSVDGVTTTNDNVVVTAVNSCNNNKVIVLIVKMLFVIYTYAK